MPASPQPKRPAPITRTSSSGYQLPQSPSSAQTPPTRSVHHKPQRHVVGHVSSRVGPRNPSFGKNINKLAKLTPIDPGEDKDSTKHHQRTPSGNPTPSSSPRPGHVKRNASALAIAHETSRTAASAHIRKNYSSGQLHRPGSSKALSKQLKQEARPGMKRSTSYGKGQQVAKSPKSPKHTSVRFAFGNDEEQDEGWTEDSASQSPSTTRDNTRNNTRSNSIIIDAAKSENQAPEQADTQPRTKPPQHPDGHTNGGPSYHSSRPPDADAITSRLLQRHPSNNAPPQTSRISAVVRAHDHDPSPSSHALSGSQSSTLAGTPGAALVSRFINGEASTVGTPTRDSPAALHHRQQQHHPSNLSTPNLSPPTPPSEEQQDRPKTASSTSKSDPAAAKSPKPPTPLPSSRTQQKLWLQRAATTIEPASLVPAILPRTGTGPAAALAGLGAHPLPFATTSTHHPLSNGVDGANGSGDGAGAGAGGGGGVGGAGMGEDGSGRMDPRLQRLFDQVSGGYRAVRRFRDPLGEAVTRAQQVQGRREQQQQQQGGRGEDGMRRQVSVRSARSGTGTERSSRGREEVGSGAGRQGSGRGGGGKGREDGARRKPKVSFEGVGGRMGGDEGGEVETRPGSLESADGGGRSAGDRGRDDVQEICRRMWGMLDSGMEE
ncbi:MAG: hypothetical protein M1821_004088 [Bathelium mastoideum]|nr:MAG: hypothetical protein M1821_004088 [Bathelium mastoideum]